MAEEAYPKDHPAHPDNAGKHFSTPPTPWTHDYMPGNPVRGGAGQPVPTRAVTGEPFDGFKHLAGLPGHTLAELEAAFSALGKEEQAARMEWNKKGIPAKPEEGA